MYGFILAGILAITTVSAYKIQGGKLEKAEQQIIDLKVEKKNLVDAVELNEAAIASCVAVNHANAQEAADQIAKSERIVNNMRKLNTLADQEINRIRNQADDQRRNDDKVCRTLTEPLPALADWLRDKRTAQGHH